MNSYCIAIDNGVSLSMPELYLSDKICLFMYLNEFIFYSICDSGDHQIIVHFSATGIDVLSDHVYVVVNRPTYKMLKKALKEFIIS